MTRHYSTKDFFRQIPNDLLARYFHQRGMFEDLDFSGMKEAKPDELWTAWMALSEKERAPLETEFRQIFDVGCEKGFRAILDEARWQMRESPEALEVLVEDLSALLNHYHRAMTTFLDHPECWKGASLFYHADTLSYWRKRKHLGHEPAAVDEGSIKQLAGQIRTYFHRTEGRGNNCVVEPFRRGDLDYFFAYPEDYSQQSIEWVDGEFGRRPHNPAFEVVYVYSQEEGTLDLNFRGAYKAIEPLQAMFAAAILKLAKLPPDPEDDHVYELNPLSQRSFSFTYDVGSGIESVVVKKLRLSSRVKKGDRITLEADPKQDPAAIYDLLDDVGQAVPLYLYNVTQVELAASVVVDAGKPAKKVPIRITYPNSCSLKYDEVDLRLRAMLVASGIEPKASAATGATET